MTKCELCFRSGVVHVTDASQNPPVAYHFCQRHTPPQFAKTMQRETGRIWGGEANRQMIAEMLSKKAGISAHEARTLVENYVKQLGKRE